MSYSHVCVCLLVSSHPHILIPSGTYVLVGILRSLHPRILIYSDSCVFGCILASSHPYVIFPGLYVFTCILPSSHPCIVRFVRTCWYPCIVISSDSYVFPFVLASSYPQIHVCFLLSLHLVIVIFLYIILIYISQTNIWINTLKKIKQFTIQQKNKTYAILDSTLKQVIVRLHSRAAYLYTYNL